MARKNLQAKQTQSKAGVNSALSGAPYKTS